MKKELGLSPGWPSSVTPFAFPLPLGRWIAEQSEHPEIHWHVDALPATIVDPEPASLPRVDAASGEHARRVQVRGGTPEAAARIQQAIMLAQAELHAVPEPVEIVILADADPRLAPNCEAATNEAGCLIRSRFAEPEDDGGSVRLLFWLTGACGEIEILRLGVESRDLGALLIEAAGRYIAYRCLTAIDNDAVGRLVRAHLSRSTSLQDLGAHLGLEAAGDVQATKDLDAWAGIGSVDPDLRELVAMLRNRWSFVETFGEFVETVEEFIAAVDHEAT